MGWWGQYIHGYGKNGRPTMQQVRERIEQDTHLTVKQVRYGYAICVADKKAIQKYNLDSKLENFICISLWDYSSKDGYLNIKNVDETMGPCQRDIPLKYLYATCEASKDNKFAINWRADCRTLHFERRIRMTKVRNLQEGDKLTVYGKDYTYCGRTLFSGKKFIIRGNDGIFHATRGQLFT